MKVDELMKNNSVLLLNQENLGIENDNGLEISREEIKLLRKNQVSICNSELEINRKEIRLLREN